MKSWKVFYCQRCDKIMVTDYMPAVATHTACDGKTPHMLVFDKYIGEYPRCLARCEVEEIVRSRIETFGLVAHERAY